MMGRRAAGCAGLVVCLLLGSARAQAPRYRVRVVEGVRECAQGIPQALDERGQVVGGRCLWNPAGLLPPPDEHHPDVFAQDLAGGVAVGHVVDDDRGFDTPMIWAGGQPQRLPLAPGFTQGLGLYINAHRDVLGQMSNNTAGTQTAIWPQAGAPSVVTLSPQAGNRDLRGFNDRQQIVGCASFRNLFGGHIVPFLWSDGQTRVLEPSSSADPSGCALAVNDAGLVAGESDQRPVLWRDGKLVRLAPPGLTGYAEAVNDQGAVIGVLDGRAFYSDGASLWDLRGLIDDAGQAAALGRFLAINDAGQILANRPSPGGPFSGVALLEPQAPRAGDAPPLVTMTSPWNGEPLVDLVTLQASASDDVAVAGVQFFANGKPVGPEDTTAPYTAEVDALEPASFHARARDTAGNLTSSPLRFAVVSRSCQAARAGQAVTGAFAQQSRQFTARFTILATRFTEGGFALSSGTPGGFAATSAAVLFAPDGEIKVRNGSAYAGTGVAYRPGIYHHFRLAVDVPARRYSVWLKLANQPERLLAAGQAFRVSAVTRLDHWMLRADESSPADLTACNVRVP